MTALLIIGICWASTILLMIVAIWRCCTGVNAFEDARRERIAERAWRSELQTPPTVADLEAWPVAAHHRTGDRR